MDATGGLHFLLCLPLPNRLRSMMVHDFLICGRVQPRRQREWHREWLLPPPPLSAPPPTGARPPSAVRTTSCSPMRPRLHPVRRGDMPAELSVGKVTSRAREGQLKKDPLPRIQMDHSRKMMHAEHSVDGDEADRRRQGG